MGNISAWCKKQESKCAELDKIIGIVEGIISNVIKAEMTRIAADIQAGKTIPEIGQDVLQDLSKQVTQVVIDELNSSCNDLCKSN